MTFGIQPTNTANNIINRITTSNDKNSTPFEKWFDKKPNLSHLRIFGSKDFEQNKYF